MRLRHRQQPRGYQQILQLCCATAPTGACSLQLCLHLLLPLLQHLPCLGRFARCSQSLCCCSLSQDVCCTGAGTCHLLQLLHGFCTPLAHRLPAFGHLSSQSQALGSTARGLKGCQVDDLCCACCVQL